MTASKLVRPGYLVAFLLGIAISGCAGEEEGGIESTETTVGPMAYLADDSFQENRIGARFVPVLGDAANLQLGARFDTLTGQLFPAGRCVARSSYSPRSQGGRGFQIRLVEVTDSYSQMKALDIDASVQGSFLGASGKFKSKYGLKQTFTQNSQNFLLYAKDTPKPQTMEPTSGTLFTLTGDAEKVLGDPQKFRALCGDAFVVTIFEGIELYGMLTFTDVNQSEKKDISVALSASYGHWSASGDANHTVNSAFNNKKASFALQINGLCDLGDLGDSQKSWNAAIGAAAKLPGCAKTGANPVKFKVVPYSSTFIRGWKDAEGDDPDLNGLLYYYSAYGALLDSINPLLTNRTNAYKLALLDRGQDLDTLETLADKIRGQRKGLIELLEGCQSVAPKDRLGDCQNQPTLQSYLNDNYLHPYIYRAQLPLFFTDSKPTEAFWKKQRLADAILQSNVQYPRDVACNAADQSGASTPACPDDYPEIKEEAKQKIHVAAPLVPRETHYVFQTESTSAQSYCLTAGPKLKTETTVSRCHGGRQRLLWLENGLLKIRSAPQPQCVNASKHIGGKAGNQVCDVTRWPTQQFRFVATRTLPKNQETEYKHGMLQTAYGLCLDQPTTSTTEVVSAECDPTDSSLLWTARKAN